MEDINLNKSLEELENSIWRETDFPTALVEKCFYARKKKLKDLDIGEVRLLITQKIGLKYIIPLAISFLKKDVLIDAGFYEGDLLLAVLTIPESFWSDNSNFKDEFLKLLSDKENYMKDFPDLSDTIKEKIIKAYSSFKSMLSN